MPVHLYGHPCAMDDIMALARAHDLMVVEDAAQAHGATIGGRKIGSHGDAVAWSFYPTKNFGCVRRCRRGHDATGRISRSG